MSLLNREEINKKAEEVRRLLNLREAELEKRAAQIAPTYVKLVEKDLVTLVAGGEKHIVHTVYQQPGFEPSGVWNHVHYILADNIRDAGFYTKFLFAGSDIVGIRVFKTEKDLEADSNEGNGPNSKRKRGK